MLWQVKYLAFVSMHQLDWLYAKVEALDKESARDVFNEYAQLERWKTGIENHFSPRKMFDLSNYTPLQLITRTSIDMMKAGPNLI